MKGNYSLPMHNPYQAPKSKVQDLNHQPLPEPLKILYWLMGAAIACAVFSMMVSLFLVFKDISWLQLLAWYEQLIFVIIAPSSFGLLFIFYYFLVFRPLHKRKRSTSNWWFSAILVSVGLWLVIFLLPTIGDETETTWIEDTLSVLELGFLILGAFLARRPAALQYLPN